MLSLFRAKTEEDLKRLEGLGVPFVTQAIGAYREVVVSPEFVELERLRADALHNEAAALANERRKAEKAKAIEMAIKMLANGEPVDKVVLYTGLTQKEVEKLHCIPGNWYHSDSKTQYKNESLSTDNVWKD